MYEYKYDTSSGGLVLVNKECGFSREPRPVYAHEMSVLGFEQFCLYEKQNQIPYMWAEANCYYYYGRLVAKVKGGSLYEKPELQIIEPPEPEGIELKPIDLDAMIEQNQELMETLIMDSVKIIANTYEKYRSIVDIFHVSYSGGKDSEVTLDLVKRALPHDGFVVIFGDTGMEFPDTYCAVKQARMKCEQDGIKFYIARSRFTPDESWRLFGPPATSLRWCCSVHKTAPQLLKLREILGYADFREMAFVGVRGDESLIRSGYDVISQGTKHRGQYSCNPILDWSSAEVYLYLYMHNLQINDAYRKGNNRAGCLVCPMSGDKSDYMRHVSYTGEVERFIDLIRETDARGFDKDTTDRVINNGGWKVRTNGRDIKTLPNKYTEDIEKKYTRIDIENPSVDWKEWIKTIGDLVCLGDKYILSSGKGRLMFKVFPTEKGYHVDIEMPDDNVSFLLVKKLKQVFRKAAYCVLCRECEADCQHGYISMLNGKLSISEHCLKCGNCHKPDLGCLLYKSLVLPKGTGMVKGKSLDRYGEHAPKPEWIVEYMDKFEGFWDDNALGVTMISNFRHFLEDAGLLIQKNNITTPFAHLIKNIGLHKAESWGLMLVNLSYTPEIGWYIKNITPNMPYKKLEISNMLLAEGVKNKAIDSIPRAYRRILALPFGHLVGLGHVDIEGAGKSKTYVYTRVHWLDPDPRVILYSLYKFAEACDGYYQFTLTRLMNDKIESAGVSPTQIFGLDRETMGRLLNGLSIDYREFISASFTHDLDNISLNPEKTSEDVLGLFD